MNLSIFLRENNKTIVFLCSYFSNSLQNFSKSTEKKNNRSNHDNRLNSISSLTEKNNSTILEVSFPL